MTDIDRLIGFMAIMQVPFMNDPDALMYIGEVKATLKTLKAREWISVKDRFPCDGVFVLVCNDDGHMMIAKYESELVRWEYKYTNYDHDVWDDDEQGPVCYWMPLPEPPKEGT